MSCGTSSSQNNTYLVETAVTSTSPSPCVYEICRASNSVCRIRFDFKVRSQGGAENKKQSLLQFFSMDYKFIIPLLLINQT